MVGDVNIYMNDLDDPHMAEIEIMVAESKRYLVSLFMLELLVLLFINIITCLLHVDFVT